MKQIFLAFLVVLPLLLSAQRVPAEKQIRELKNTVLLVRLKTAENQIDALKKAGHEEKAGELQEKKDRENREICRAFQENFSFCPVYFFYSYDSKKVKEGNWQSAIVDSDLKPVKGMARPVPTFYVAEFGNIERTDEKYYSSSGMGVNQEGLGEKQDYYYGSPDMGFSALIMRDNQFLQLRDPFPYYVRTYESLPLFKRNKNKSVKKLDRKLGEYYNTVISKTP